MMRTGIGNPLTRMSIRQQLVLLFFILVSPVFLLDWYGNGKAEEILKRHVTEAYVELSEVSHQLIGRDLETINQVTKTIIQNPLTQGMKSLPDETTSQRFKKYTEVEKLLSNYSHGDEGDVIPFALYVYDPNDEYFFAPENFNLNSGVYFYNDEDKPVWIDEAIERKGSGYLSVIERPWLAQSKSTLVYIRAVKSISRNNDVIGVLVVSNLDVKIDDSLRSVDLPGGEIYLTDESNRILATTHSGIGSVLDLPEEVKARINPGATIDYVSSGYIYVVQSNAHLRQNLVYRIPMETLLRQQSELTRVIQLISFVYSAFALLVMFYLWRSLITPLQNLVRFLRAYEPGKLVPMTPGSGRKDEVGTLISSVYNSARRMNDLVEERYMMEIKQKESQLTLLYQQINPHLLYNTLESIYWKSSLEGNTESAEMIKELAKLMKIALSRGRELIKLEEELEHARAYTGLQQKRYDYDFEVEWRIDPCVLETPIPKIVIQPLIENAIIHGVKNMGEDGRIRISAEEKDGTVFIRVEDNGYKPVDIEAIDRLLNARDPDPSLGYGIRNVHERIHMHFGSAYGLRYGRLAEGDTVATLEIPASARTGQS